MNHFCPEAYYNEELELAFVFVIVSFLPTIRRGVGLPSVAAYGITLEGADPGPFNHGFETCPGGTRRVWQAVEADRAQWWCGGELGTRQ